MKKYKFFAYLLVFISIFSFIGTGCFGDSQNEDEESISPIGSKYPPNYRAKVIEKNSDYELIVEILPHIRGDSEYSVITREKETSLIDGDIVKAIFDKRNLHNDFKERLNRVSIGDVVSISFPDIAGLSFDFSASPIVVNCDTIQLYYEDGKTRRPYP